MTVDRMIKKALWDRAADWIWQDEHGRFLACGSVELVRPLGKRWSLKLGDIGLLQLSRTTHFAIEWVRRFHDKPPRA